VTNDAGREAVANLRNGVHHHSYLIHRVTVTMHKSRSRWNRIAERGDGMVNFGVAGNGRDARWLCSHGSPFLPDHLASVASFFGPANVDRPSLSVIGCGRPFDRTAAHCTLRLKACWRLRRKAYRLDARQSQTPRVRPVRNAASNVVTQRRAFSATETPWGGHDLPDGSLRYDRTGGEICRTSSAPPYD
jgi:hypothetical protein